MDTIIYFYQKRELEKPAIESHRMKDYLLVRVGLNVGEDRWFAHSLMPPVAISVVEEQQPAQKPTLLERWQTHRKKREARRRYRRQQEQFQRELAEAQRELVRFLDELGHYVEERYDCHCVYSDAVRKCLADGKDTERELQGKRDGLSALWQKYWFFPEFADYFEPQWVEPLLVYAKLHHFVVLGTSSCIRFILPGCARRMKSLRWFLAERDCTEELQDFVEDFYEDCGLAAALQPLEGEKVFTRLLLETREPVCVLDFSGEPRIPTGGLAPGSIWIDFASVEEKARRISEREESIAYYSMKEIWKRAGKP